ncbi:MULTISPECIES: hypothetical protein [Methylomicrobium]|uniref:hypothetical protein n=1 Tax=Methylomicrobium TaxID=39773 RepID=UPI00146FCBD1|nr:MULTISPECIES: hypothetical protein [Methylomicrobium]
MNKTKTGTEKVLLLNSSAWGLEDVFWGSVDIRQSAEFSCGSDFIINYVKSIHYQRIIAEQARLAHGSRRGMRALRLSVSRNGFRLRIGSSITSPLVFSPSAYRGTPFASLGYTPKGHKPL